VREECTWGIGPGKCFCDWKLCFARDIPGKGGLPQGLPAPLKPVNPAAKRCAKRAAKPSAKPLAKVGAKPCAKLLQTCSR